MPRTPRQGVAYLPGDKVWTDEEIAALRIRAANGASTGSHDGSSWVKLDPYRPWRGGIPGKFPLSEHRCPGCNNGFQHHPTCEPKGTR